MKFRAIMIATGLLAAVATAASAESVYEPNGSGVRGQSAQQEEPIRYLSSGRDGSEQVRTERSTQGASYGSGSVDRPNVLRDGRG